MNTYKEIIDLHYHILRTQIILEKIINTDSDINSIDIEKANSEAIKILQEKFPSLDIRRMN